MPIADKSRVECDRCGYEHWPDQSKFVWEGNGKERLCGMCQE